MPNENDAANRFIAQLQEGAANAGNEPDDSHQPQHVVINRPVRCVFYLSFNRPADGMTEPPARRRRERPHP